MLEVLLKETELGTHFAKEYLPVMNDITVYSRLRLTYNMCSLFLLFELAGSERVRRHINHQQNPHDTDRGNIPNI